ncbi:programmed cell death protein 5 [Chelmon rostratus]|uniref:programmed cell death protein 5 n=1 Tax=Chelmon rostratus TaxID=109905 RepID=UPI001BEA1808|nr:programmed cell death protein 5 [Chelmon rostratus]
MADDELEAIRRRRMAELQAKQGGASNNQQAEEAKQRETEMRNSILAQVLDQSARARLSSLALVKPEKANAVQNYLIQMAQFGKLSGKISESGLIEILKSQQTEKKTTVTFNRQRVMDSDDEDD